MKIDRKRPMHWFYLSLFFVQSVAGLLLRSTVRGKHQRTVILYGHKLNGNLLALQRYLAQQGDAPQAVFLTMDRQYCQKLRQQGVQSAWACGLQGAWLLATANALIADHGLHVLQLFIKRFQAKGMRFIDVWHGIPFKGFDAADFRVQHKFDEIWVASPLCRELYIERFGFDANKVHVTGYARTDALVNYDQQNILALQRSLGLDPEARVILFAPTWQQDDKTRQIYPFGCGEQEFLTALDEIGSKHQAVVLVRTHLNSNPAASIAMKNVRFISAAEYPDTEAVLLVSDLLICDWSSIAFDYLLLNRPTIFLDVEPPFRKGFSLGAEYRFGTLAGNITELITIIKVHMEKPESRQGSVYYENAKGEVYAEFADGAATDRCYSRLKHIACLSDAPKKVV